MIHPDWCYGAVIYELNVRQLTPEGSINAAAKKLKFLKSVGVDIIWLMPIYPIGEVERKGELGSYYAIKDYTAVNEEFGSLADLDKFLKQAHKLGMRVILDWVANHTARDNRWVKECPEDWYERDEAGEPLVPWDWSDTAKLNYQNHEVWGGQIEAMKFWLKRGVDGFRCDMAMLVPIEFWQQAATELHRENPDIFMLAEAEQTNLFDGAFDACYGWELHHLMCDVAKGNQRADRLRDFLYQDRGYPRWAIPMMFTSNHDENSWQGTEQARFGASLGVMTLFTFVAPAGMPLIYTGQEVGYDHSFEFFDKDNIPAESYVEGAETAIYRRLCEIKHSYKSLAAGEMGGVWYTINNNAEDCLLILVRESGEDRVLAVMNMSPYRVDAAYNLGCYAGLYRDGFSGEEVAMPIEVKEPMEPWSYRLLLKKK